MPLFAETLRANRAKAEQLLRDAEHARAADDLMRINYLCHEHSLQTTLEMCRIKKSAVRMTSDLRAAVEAEGIVVGEFEGDEEEWWTFSW